MNSLERIWSVIVDADRRIRFRSAPDVGSEQRARGNLERDVSHLVVDVARLARDPLVNDVRGDRDHACPHSLHPLAVEARLHQTPLPQPEVALTDQQAVAERRAQMLAPQAPLEIAIVGDKQLLDRSG